jgi:hypothetical protein
MVIATRANPAMAVMIKVAKICWGRIISLAVTRKA